MNMSLLKVLLSALCCALYAYDWYLGTLLPAWVALLWCAAVFLNDLHDYLEGKYFN